MSFSIAQISKSKVPPCIWHNLHKLSVFLLQLEIAQRRRRERTTTPEKSKQASFGEIITLRDVK
ncbi:hypothetical protein T07_4486 [Trichinella nelsoni]|uniref:Uncharacterized protein n=1 Tax=Trichinella nelsoni TaxID=6336 RepID=A0A0V0RSL3_9BILA|nr:hypothetical protein T07_4486 [Trichinella nelsoni]